MQRLQLGSKAEVIPEKAGPSQRQQPVFTKGEPIRRLQPLQAAGSQIAAQVALGRMDKDQRGDRAGVLRLRMAHAVILRIRFGEMDAITKVPGGEALGKGAHDERRL